MTRSFITYLLHPCQEKFLKLKIRDYLEKTTLFMKNFFTKTRLHTSIELLVLSIEVGN